MAPFEVPLATTHVIQPPRLFIQEPSDLSGLNPHSLPFDFIQQVPLSSSWAAIQDGLRFLYIVHLLYIVSFPDDYSFVLFFIDSIPHCLILLINYFCIPSRFSFFFVQSNPSVQKWFFQLLYSSAVFFNHCLTIVQLFFNIVQYSGHGNIFQVFQSK
jgi:hypothetical protein